MLRKLKILKWSTRKLKLPIFGKGLILDVGSGANPHPFADILLEKYLDNTHRFKAAKIDRPMVLGDASRMPFKANAFKYVLAYHVLEHLHEPGAFLDELQRVGEAGYIETPNALYERIHPFSVHLLEILLLNDTLHIYKKNGPVGDDFIGSIDLLGRDKKWKEFFYSNPRLFHNCYYWKGKISYKLLNPDRDTGWFDDPDTNISHAGEMNQAEGGLRSHLLSLMKKFNNKKIDLGSILACPECQSDVVLHESLYHCSNGSCGLMYAAEPIPNFNHAV